MEEKIYKIISFNLVRLRNINRYSQSQIATILHISQPSYNHIEAGKSRIAIHHLIILACFYQVTIEDFFIEKSESPSNLENFVAQYIAMAPSEKG